MELFISFITQLCVSILIKPPSGNFKMLWTWRRRGKPRVGHLRILQWNMMGRLTVRLCDCRFGPRAFNIF